MSRTIFVTFTAALVLLIVSIIPLSAQGHGNAEVKHQQLITEQLQKPSMQEKFETYLAKDDNIRLTVKKSTQKAIHDDPAFTMECKEMAEDKKMSCCNMSDVKENTRNGQQRHGNAELRHQQLIAERLQIPSMQEMFDTYLATDEQIRLIVKESMHKVILDDPALTMECKKMAEAKEMTCCNSSDVKENNRNGQKRGNAEVRHQQLIAEQLQQPSIQDMFTNFLAADENIPLMVMESIHNAMQDDPALTMECGLMAEYSEIACCSLAKAEKDNEHRDHH